jgi:cytochrome c
MVALACLVAYAQEEKKPVKKVDPKAELKASIERGRKLFGDAELGTSGLTCNSCHKDGGTKPGKMGDITVRAFRDLDDLYPGYWMMPGAEKVMTLDQVINFCITNPLKGEALAWDDQRLADLAAYCISVGEMLEEEEEDNDDD